MVASDGVGGRARGVIAAHNSQPAFKPHGSLVLISGGHTVHGDEKEPLDIEKIKQVVGQTSGELDAYAVCGYFSVRNPDHELRAKKLIQEMTDKPVVCGHEISLQLDAVKRATTTLLNAHLIPIIWELFDSVKRVFKEQKISAPLMIVKGDGSLVSESAIRERPIETILSGPAASVIGAKYLLELSGETQNAVIVDIGGTTTDIAQLKEGTPRLNPEGAKVGDWKTNVVGIDIRTIGLGGDSQISVDYRGALCVGPRRIIPLSYSGGALAMAFIPLLTESLTTKHRAAAWDLFSRVANLAFVVTGSIAVLVFIFAEQIVEAEIGIAPGFGAEQRTLLADLMRLNLIGTIIFSISGLVMASLQANQHFLLPALAPTMYNIGQIFGAIYLVPQFGIHGLVYGVIIGAALHLLVQIPALFKYEFKWTHALDLRDTGLISALKLLGPRLLTMFGIQLIVIPRDTLASRLDQVGAVTLGPEGEQIRITRRAWRRPLAGGMTSSTRSVKANAPTRSFSRAAARARTAATSTARSPLDTGDPS